MSFFSRTLPLAPPEEPDFIKALRAMGACSESIRRSKDLTIEQAWELSTDTDRMFVLNFALPNEEAAEYCLALWGEYLYQMPMEDRPKDWLQAKTRWADVANYFASDTLPVRAPPDFWATEHSSELDIMELFVEAIHDARAGRPAAFPTEPVVEYDISGALPYSFCEDAITAAVAKFSVLPPITKD